MRSIKTIYCALLLGVLFCATSLKADVWNKKTIMTVNQPMRVLDTTLGTGTYVFKLADSNSNRHIVHIFNSDESEVLATILAIPNYRLRVTGDSEFGFWEVPQGATAALKSWFYPGDNFGQEFPYRPEPAVARASVSQEVREEVAIAEVETAPAPAAEPAPEPVVEERRVEEAEVAAVEQPAAPVEETPAPTTEEPAAGMQEERQLPRTASLFPLLGLTGLLSLGVAFVIGAFRS